MPNAGDEILAEDSSGYATDAESASGTTTSTSFTSTLTGGTACEVTFTAPTSGLVLVVIASSIDNDSSGIGSVSFQVAAGASPGSGFLAASTVRALRHQGTDLLQGTFVYPLTGLTADSQYTVQQMFAVSAGTGTFANKTLTTVPIP